MPLLKKAKFCSDCNALPKAHAAKKQLPLSLEAFVEKWGVVPPPNYALLEPDIPQEKPSALLAGDWGVIPVCPTTTNGEIREALKRSEQRLYLFSRRVRSPSTSLTAASYAFCSSMCALSRATMSARALASASTNMQHSSSESQ